MKNIVLIVSLIAMLPAYGMHKEPLVKEDVARKKSKARTLLIINNTMHRQPIRIGHRLYSIRFHDYKWITTDSEIIKINGTVRELNPKKGVLCLGAEPREWSDDNDDVDDKPKMRKSASFCELPRLNR